MDRPAPRQARIGSGRGAAETAVFRHLPTALAADIATGIPFLWTTLLSVTKIPPIGSRFRLLRRRNTGRFHQTRHS